MEDLIIYSSTDGQTKRICETIKDHLALNDNEDHIILLKSLIQKSI